MLARWDPFVDLLNLRRRMDRWYEDFLGEETQMSENIYWRMPVDVVESEGEFIVKASVPGIHPDDVEVTFSDSSLIIQGEVAQPEGGVNVRYHINERPHGRFYRSISIPTSIDANNIAADYDAGVFTLHLPKTEEVKPKKITVQPGSQRMLESKVKETA